MSPYKQVSHSSPKGVLEILSWLDGGRIAIDAKAFALLAPYVRIVDIREPSEYNKSSGLIPGAELVPSSVLSKAAETWPKAVPLVLVCSTGERSVEAARALAGRGFERAMCLEGGFVAYEQAGLPLQG